jgi:hypothetical protein
MLLVRTICLPRTAVSFQRCCDEEAASSNPVFGVPRVVATAQDSVGPMIVIKETSALGGEKLVTVVYPEDYVGKTIAPRLPV